MPRVSLFPHVHTLSLRRDLYGFSRVVSKPYLANVCHRSFRDISGSVRTGWFRSLSKSGSWAVMALTRSPVSSFLPPALPNTLTPFSAEFRPRNSDGLSLLSMGCVLWLCTLLFRDHRRVWNSRTLPRVIHVSIPAKEGTAGAPVAISGADCS